MYIIVTESNELLKEAKEHGCKIFEINEFRENDLNSLIVSSNSHAYLTKFLKDIGVPVHVKGYKYIRYVLEQILTVPDFDTKGMTTEVYPMVAKAFSTSKTAAERNIRTTIELTFNRGDIKLLKEIFSHAININKGKPTNAEFFSIIGLYIKENMM